MSGAETAAAIPGYDYGTSLSATSPVTETELRYLEQAAGWTQQDADILGRHADAFRTQAEAMVDSWR